MTPEPSTLIKIEYDNKIFLLSIMYDNYNITMNISEENNLSDLIFSKKMTLSDIKGMHILFSGISKLEEFIDYMKAASENKKLSIVLKEDKLVINIISEYLFKQHNIEIILLSKKLNTSEMITNLCQEISLPKKK
jgi:hypothetical protein